MLPSTTETQPEGAAIDALPMHEAAARFVAGQQAALATVNHAKSSIADGAEIMASAIRGGGALLYVAAGTSGLMALADASELTGTFGIPADAIQIHMAGGVPVDGRMPGDTEDDTKAAQTLADTVAPGDVVIALSASGTTPFTLAIAAAAKAKGAQIIAIANNPRTPLLDLADIAICLETPPEVIAGSTRLGAGTAQKAALNLMSSLMGIKLGHVFQGLMVNVIADNAKLVRRAAGIVTRIAGVPTAQAEAALAQAGGDVKTAILVASGSPLDAARKSLAAHSGHLGPCLRDLSTNQNTIEP